MKCNPFKPDGLSHCYQLDRSISALSVVRWYFTSLFIFQLNILYKQTVETLIKRRDLRRLIWVSTVCNCPTETTLGSYGLSEVQELFEPKCSCMSMEKSVQPWHISLILQNTEQLHYLTIPHRLISVVDVVGPMNPYQPIYTIPHLIFCRIPVQNFNLC